jgi:hypothetical protein
MAVRVWQVTNLQGFMPSVFLSYSREDLPLVEQLASRLTAASDIKIWRDQEKIYGGQKWPKILGEAIADQDVFLLAWSKNTAESHFVEFEWTTAIALKKSVVPCFLDDTPLPASLKAFHGHSAIDTSGIIRTLQGSPLADAARRAPVIQSLDEIAATDEKEVLEQVSNIFNQQRWVVKGDVFQAGRDIHYHAAPESQRGQKRKSLLDNGLTWVTLIGGLLTIVTLTLGILDKLPWSISGDARGKTFDQPVAGQVIDATTGDPLPGVRVSVIGFQVEPKTTNQDGHFRFDRLRGEKQQKIDITARKDCYKVETIGATLGNTNLRPALEPSDSARCHK